MNEKWSKNTFWTGSEGNNNLTFPDSDSLVRYDDAVDYSETNGTYRLITDDELKPCGALNSNTFYGASQTKDWYGDMVNYAPSIFIRFWTINDINSTYSGNSGSLSYWLPGLKQILIFIDHAGTSTNNLQNWSSHTQLSTPLRIPTADFALRWNCQTTHSIHTNSTWFYDANEHWMFINNSVARLANQYMNVIIVFVPNASAVVSGRVLRLPVSYNLGGDGSAAGYLDLKACKIQYGNYMFNDTQSGSTTVSGYGWGGTLGCKINNSGSPYSSISFTYGRYSGNTIIKQDSGGWT